MRRSPVDPTKATSRPSGSGLFDDSLGHVSFDPISGLGPSLSEPGKTYEETLGLSLRAPTLATPPAGEEDND